MVAGVSSTLDVAGSAQDLQRSVQYLLPGTVSYTVGPTAATVSGRQAFRLDGMVSDPQRQGRLDFATYVVARDSGFAAYLTFFCAPDHCDRARIDQILASLREGQPVAVGRRIRRVTWLSASQSAETHEEDRSAGRDHPGVGCLRIDGGGALEDDQP
jgi:hypothetical protein